MDEQLTIRELRIEVGKRGAAISRLRAQLELVTQERDIAIRTRAALLADLDRMAEREARALWMLDLLHDMHPAIYESLDREWQQNKEVEQAVLCEERGGCDE